MLAASRHIEVYVAKLFSYEANIIKYNKAIKGISRSLYLTSYLAVIC